MLKDYTLQTTWKKVLVSLISGAMLGAAIIAAYYLFGTYLRFGGEYLVKYSLSNGAGIFLYAFIVWGGGLMIIGGPIWLLLHLKGYRTLPVALFLGFGLPFMATFLTNREFLTGYSEGWSSYSQGGQQWLDGRLTSFGWWMAAAMSAVMAVYGALVALLVWYISYGEEHEIVADV